MGRGGEYFCRLITWSEATISKKFENPSLNHTWSHHLGVTILPNHMCEISCPKTWVIWYLLNRDENPGVKSKFFSLETNWNRLGRGVVVTLRHVGNVVLTQKNTIPNFPVRCLRSSGEQRNRVWVKRHERRINFPNSFSSEELFSLRIAFYRGHRVATKNDRRRFDRSWYCFVAALNILNRLWEMIPDKLTFWGWFRTCSTANPIVLLWNG